MRCVIVVVGFGAIAWGLVWNPFSHAASPTKADRLSGAELAEKPMEVLGGRLMVRMPEGARLEPRQYPIMGAPEPESHKSRVTLKAGREKLVLMAAETFALAGDDLERDVRGWLAKGDRKYLVESLQLRGPRLKAVVVTPASDPDHSRSDDATFVEGLFVMSDGRTIQSLDVYVNAAAEKHMAACRALAHRILLSVATGKRKLEMRAGERRLSAFSKKVEISVLVDANTVATTQAGPDFLVHRLIALGPLGADSGTVGIYVGHHPDFEPGMKKGSGTMFGKTVDWHSFDKGKRLETLCGLPIPGEDGLKAHIWIQTSNHAQLETMKKTAESMKLVKSKGGVSK
jgi:hypothetical protein